MTVGVLIIAHRPLGSAVVETAIGTLGECPLPLQVLDVPRDGNPENTLAQARAHLAQLDDGDGVLVLTDLFGSTPCNIACNLRDPHRVLVLAGLNLPMLIRVFNYPQLALLDLLEKAAGGGRDGIVLCENMGVRKW